MQRIRSRLTYANVTATMALFIALGGSSYAVSGRETPMGPSSATARISLATNTVRGTNIVNGSITTADIGTGQVVSSDIRDGTVGVADLSPEVVDRLKKVKTPKNKNGDNQSTNTTTTPSTLPPGTSTTPITPLP
jgi:hypothetical protein